MLHGAELVNNQNFINVVFDGEKGDGKMLMQRYKLSSFPSLLFINGNGKVYGQTIGFHNSNQLIELGQIFLKE